MLSRRHLAERNFRNYGCHDDAVQKFPSFVDPIGNGERLVRRPPRRTPEKETTTRKTVAGALRENVVQVAHRSRAGILKLPPSSAESSRVVRRDRQGRPCQLDPSESVHWNVGRNLRWSEEDMERTGIGSGVSRATGMDDFQHELSHLAMLQEEFRKTVENRKKLKSLSCSEDPPLHESSTTKCKQNPGVQSCPDLRSVVNEFRNVDRNPTPVRLLKPCDAGAQNHRPQHPSSVSCHQHPLIACSAIRGNAHEENQLPSRVRGRSLEHFGRTPNNQRHVSVLSLSRSRTRNAGSDRETIASVGPRSDWDVSGPSRPRSRAGTVGYEGISAGPSDRAPCRPSVYTCSCCGNTGKESPDSRRERLLMQERWDAGVWAELRSLLQTIPATSDGRQMEPCSQASKSSSSNETIYGCQRNRGGGVIGGGGGCITRGRRGRETLYDKMTQTEYSSRYLRAAGTDRGYNRPRRSGETVQGRSVSNGCQAAAAANRDQLDAHNCDSSITEITSIWPSTSAESGGTQDGTSGGTAVTTTSTTDATTACQSQESSLSLLQSISAELLGSSVSSECLRAAIDATTGGHPLDENSVLDAIDREMADVNQFVRETLDVSEIKPKEYLQMHMKHLQKFTSNLEQFISQQKTTTTSPVSYESSDSASTALQRR